MCGILHMLLDETAGIPINLYLSCKYPEGLSRALTGYRTPGECFLRLKTSLVHMGVLYFILVFSHRSLTLDVG